jgi:hypothetical protein
VHLIIDLGVLFPKGGERNRTMEVDVANNEAAALSLLSGSPTQTSQQQPLITEATGAANATNHMSFRRCVLQTVPISAARWNGEGREDD